MITVFDSEQKEMITVFDSEKLYDYCFLILVFPME